MDFQLQMQENVRMIIFREKERTNNESLIFFSILKWLRKENNCIIGLCQQRTNVECMYLAVENLGRICKKGEQG